MTYRIAAIGALVLFVLSALVGLWATYDVSLSMPVFLAILISLGFFGVIVYAPVSPWRIGQVIVVIGSLVAFYFIDQYAHFDYQSETGLPATIGRVTGSVLPNLVFYTPHPNAVAGFLEGILLIDIALIWRAHEGRRWPWLISVILISYALFISSSRGAWLGIAVAIAIWVLLTFKKRALPLLIAGLGVVAGLALGIFGVLRFISPQQNILILSSAREAAQSRFTLYQNSLTLLQDYPFTGIGLGDTFAMVYSRYQLLIHVPFLYYAHNLFLSIGLGQGLLGIVALVGLVIVFYSFVLRIERVTLTPGAQVLFRAAWLGVMASLVHGLIDSVQFSSALWTMPVLFALAGIAVAVGRSASVEESDHAPQPRDRRKIVLAVGLPLVVLVIGLFFFRQSLTAAWYVNLGSIYQTRADLSPDLDDDVRETLRAEAAAYFDQALKADPTYPAAHHRLGLMALDRQDFETARFHLEQAYDRAPNHQGIIKTLGYAYLWTGEVDAAENIFRRVGFQNRLIDELDYWHWWWGTQDRPDLSGNAQVMAQRLAETN